VPRACRARIRTSSHSKRVYWPSFSSRTICYKGLLLAPQVEPYYPDLNDPDFESAIVMVHQRYSTNTFPSWSLAHPFRFVAHNGEINTVRGNSNWMKAREHQFAERTVRRRHRKLSPIIREGISDSAAFDCALELLYFTGRSLPHAVMMMIPEAWERHETMSQEKKDFYAYHASLMEPWDGPASIASPTDPSSAPCSTATASGPRAIGSRKNDHVIMASEAGVLDVPPEDVVFKGRLQPGRMFLVDTRQGRIIPDDEIKSEMARRQPYGEWLKKNLKTLKDLPAVPKDEIPDTPITTNT
jgi:glutamate synthase domain-containing protein 1